MDDDELWEQPWTTSEKVSVVIVMLPAFALLGLAWYAFMYPVLFR